MILNPDGTLTCDHGNDVALDDYPACGCAHTIGDGDIRELWNKNRMIGAAMPPPNEIGAAIDRLDRMPRIGAPGETLRDVLNAGRAEADKTFRDACAYGTGANRTLPDGAVEHAPLSALLADRGTTHGDFTSSSRTMQKFKRAARRSPNWERMDASQREALDMILHKIGRVLHGDPRHKDHWDDIAGYATLVAQELG